MNLIDPKINTYCEEVSAPDNNLLVELRKYCDNQIINYPVYISKTIDP